MISPLTRTRMAGGCSIVAAVAAPAADPRIDAVTDTVAVVDHWPAGAVGSVWTTRGRRQANAMRKMARGETQVELRRY